MFTYKTNNQTMSTYHAKCNLVHPTIQPGSVGPLAKNLEHRPYGVYGDKSKHARKALRQARRSQ